MPWALRIGGRVPQLKGCNEESTKTKRVVPQSGRGVEGMRRYRGFVPLVPVALAHVWWYVVVCRWLHWRM